MICNETREYLFAFLDGELETPLSMEFQRHLERCHNCAREIEIERAIHKQIGSVVESDLDRLPDFDATMDGLLGDEPGMASPVAAARSRGMLTWGRAFAAAAVVAMAVTTTWLGVRAYRDEASTSRFAGLLVADFVHFLEEGESVQMESSDRAALAEWLYGKTALAMVLPRPSGFSGTLVGGRKCTIDGRPAAFAVYRIDGIAASLVAVDSAHVNLKDMRRIDHASGTYWVAGSGGYTVVARPRGELVYAAVSALPEETLSKLIMEGSHAGD